MSDVLKVHRTARERPYQGIQAGQGRVSGLRRDGRPGRQ